MLANLLIRPGKTELCETVTPGPSRGEILVQIKAALTCGTDLKAFKRGHPMIPMPGLFGHEFSGIVAETGRGVKKFKTGDEIMSVHSAPCLECSYCRKKLYNLCEKIMETKVLGAFAEYILLPAHIVRQNAFHKPEDITFEEAAFLEPLSCVVHSVEPLGIGKGDNALVVGAGPIGILHLLLLKEKGAMVTIVDKHENKLKMAKKLGCDYVFLYDNYEDKIRQVIPPHPPFIKGGIKSKLLKREQEGLTNKIIPSFRNLAYSIPYFGKGGQGGISSINKLNDFIGFDYVFECTGMPEVWESSVNYVRRGGTVTLFGGCKSGTRVTYDTCRLHYDEISLKGVFHYTPADVKKAYALLCKKSLGVSRLISGRYALNQIQKAFEKLAKGEGIKYAIIP